MAKESSSDYRGYNPQAFDLGKAAKREKEMAKDLDHELAQKQELEFRRMEASQYFWKQKRTPEWYKMFDQKLSELYGIRPKKD